MVAEMNRPTKIQLSVQILVNLLTAARNIITQVGNAWNRVFGKKNSAKGFYDLHTAVEKFTEKLILSEESAQKLEDTFAGLFSVIDLLAEIIGAAFSEGLRVISELFGNTNVSVLDFTGSIGKNIEKIKEWIEENKIINKVFSTMGDGIIAVVNQFKDWFDQFKDLPIIHDAIDTLKEKVGNLTDKIKDWFKANQDMDDISVSLKTSLEKVRTKTEEWFETFKGLPLVQNALTTIKNIGSPIIDNIKTAFSNAVEKVKEFFSNLDPVTIDDLKKRFSEFKDKVVDAFEHPKEALQGFIDKIVEFKDSVKEWLSSINFDFEEFKEKLVNKM